MRRRADPVADNGLVVSPDVLFEHCGWVLPHTFRQLSLERLFGSFRNRIILNSIPSYSYSSKIGPSYINLFSGLQEVFTAEKPRMSISDKFINTSYASYEIMYELYR